jgi:translocation and assembly module TamB
VLTTIPKNSLLKHFDKNIRWSAISPLKLKARMGEKDIAVSLKSSKITADMKMLPLAGTVDGKIKVAGVTALLEGDKSGTIKLNSNVSSFKTLLGTVNQFYHVEDLPNVEGKLDLSVVITKNGDATLNLNSPKVLYHADRKTIHNIDDVKISVGMKGSTLLLKSYQLSYNKMHFFATKSSVVSFKDQEVTIDQLWLNDELKVTGKLDMKKMQGEILANAEKFHFAHELIDLDSKIDITTTLNGENTDVKGKVTILGGNIHYDLSTKTFPSDSDILIVQEMKKKEASPFMDHLTIALTVDTKEPLVYKEGPVDAKAKVNLGIHKAIFSDPMVIGSIDLVDGSSYVFQGKKFRLERSHIYLTGDPSKPLLDITVKYQALRHLITINVSGTPAAPSVLFSSVPSLTKEQILSIILFDSEEGAATNNANDMMKMMGGAMAKSALNNLGVKIDHLVFGEGNSVEVGKKLTDDITVIYINGEIPKMEVKYEYSPSIEVVVGASEQSESLDVVYIKDFNLGKDDDIVIKRKQ